MFLFVQGDIVRQLGDLDLATFCLCQLAELGDKKRQDLSALQLSLVYSCLKNYNKVHGVFVFGSLSGAMAAELFCDVVVYFLLFVFVVVSASASDCLERLISEMTYHESSKT